MEKLEPSNFNLENWVNSDPTGDYGPGLVQEEDPGQAAADSVLFVGSGLVVLAAGLGFLLTEATTVLTGLNLAPFYPYILGVGGAVLLFGLIKAYRKVFLKSNLNLPSLTIKKKVVRTGDLKALETFKPKGWLKSADDKVFMGIAGGLAKFMGLQPGLIRLAFIFLFFFSGGFFGLAYLALGIGLPEEQKSLPAKTHHVRIE